ncbi:chemoreceptor glutamine deamidase CheD [Alteromonas confluentis]|uniref:Probable chemoreceptor glutamine deamidase CheD n=1 Tax=Alteromonas confluentis TaxID=1656094 RepID=A0A1E7Z895_9ALTE|nr:chemoreceptor glutamine deamidase CheD [Alteromonas confluentis]OFC69624.1 chemotaxis protein CheD [Alteromonas confluentis]
MPDHDFSRPPSYYDSRFGRDAVKILPGQYYVTSADKLIVTVLGSCVAVCLYDPITEVGGMNHFMLPSNNTVSAASFEANRYGVHAMEVLLNDCLRLGAEKKRLVAKVFGGARVLPGYVSNDIGATNAAFGLEFLQTENIPVLAHDLLKNYARKVYFTPSDGSVIMKRIYDMHNNTIYEREAELSVKVNADTSKTGSVDLFDN